MQIRELYLKNFGKFQEKRLTFQDGIYILYGENESGKTTIHTFIKCMLFGLERGRGRASVHDTFSLYEPWENPSYYSGVMRFESGGKNFRLERHFDKYSKGASLVCEDDGEEFSLEHGDLEMILDGLNMSSYENTVSIGQMKAETNQSLASELQNYATNYYATGNSDIDLEGALERLNQKKKEMEREIRGKQQETQQRRYETEQEAAYVQRDIRRLEQELEEAEARIEEQELIRQEQIREEQNKGAQESRWRVHPLQLLGMSALFFFLIFLFQQPWNYLVAIVTALGECMYVWNRMKEDKRKTEKELKKEQQSSMEKILWERERIRSGLREKQIQYHNIQEKIKEFGEADGEDKNLSRKKQAVELAQQRILELSRDVHKELSAKLNAKASEILAEITDGKYERLFIDEKLKMSLYTGERRIAIEQVSRGTIEQIYFALRMAAGEILYEEEFPVILDDTFVFYDDERMERAMQWLKKHKRQVLVFTCQKRELTFGVPVSLK